VLKFVKIWIFDFIVGLFFWFLYLCIYAYWKNAFIYFLPIYFV